MILADTSVWLAHLRKGDTRLARLLMAGHVVCHRFIVGELACADMANRAEVLELLDALPPCRVADHDEVLHMVAARQLQGKAIGYVDAHLLASALLDDARLWTSEPHLLAVARSLRVSYD